MELLQKLLTRDPSSTSTIGSSSIAQKGICSKALNAFSKSNSWIINSSTSDHMTGDITLFHSYQHCSESYKIKIADGSYSWVVGKGSVILPNSFRLLSVLHVPKLTCNLLSISKVTKNLNCVTKFFPNHCEFQEMETGKMIGCAWEHEGLYIFGNKAAKGQTHKASCNVLSSFTNSNDHEIMFWHFRLGHPSFPYLKKLLPSLFKNKNLKSFHCEFYQLSKHCWNSYVHNLIKNLILLRSYIMIYGDLPILAT